MISIDVRVRDLAQVGPCRPGQSSAGFLKGGGQTVPPRMLALCYTPNYSFAAPIKLVSVAVKLTAAAQRPIYSPTGTLERTQKSTYNIPLHPIPKQYKGPDRVHSAWVTWQHARSKAIICAADKVAFPILAKPALQSRGLEASSVVGSPRVPIIW